MSMIVGLFCLWLKVVISISVKLFKVFIKVSGMVSVMFDVIRK